jgi:undecaprenyl-diphosphatase
VGGRGSAIDGGIAGSSLRVAFGNTRGGFRTSIFQAIVLGIVQGLTEFAPVSSSGHLLVVPWLFGWTFFLGNQDLNKTFDVALHVGTFVGALGYFWRDIGKYLGAWARSIRRRSITGVDERLAWLLVVATVPGVLVGALSEDVIEENLGEIWLVAVMLVVFGVVLYVVDRGSPQDRPIEDVRLRDAVLIGLAQAAALQPGVSRSGATITVGRVLRIERAAAARFSFLLSLPIIFGAGAFRGIRLLGEGLPPGSAGPFVWGMLASAVSGFLVIWGLLAYLRRHDFGPFLLYRLALGALVFTLIATGVRSASGL